MGITFDLEGVDGLSFDLSSALDDLGADLRSCVLDAGDAAITRMQTDHPYQDRTYQLSGGMQCKMFGRQTRTMANVAITFKAPYAAAVNDGTEKSRPYPFVPQGLESAAAVLEHSVSYSLDKFCATSARR